jgi:hypothetical protein
VRASREARLAERHREQVARLVALALTEDWSPVTRPLRVADLVPSILGGSHFDVAAVRAYGERLIAEETVAADCAEFRGRHNDAAVHRNRSRAGRRLLAAIEGQPSECEWCGGKGERFRGETEECSDCHGTGHNLAGTLRSVEHSAQVRRSLADARASLQRPNGDRNGDVAEWQGEILDALDAPASRHWDTFPALLDGPHPGAVGFARLAEVERLVANAKGPDVELHTHGQVRCAVTRVVPRGEHRRPEAGFYVRPQDVPLYEDGERPSLDERINGRCWDARPARHGGDLSRWPRWRRGERRHSEQRRERERRQRAEDDRVDPAPQWILDAATGSHTIDVEPNPEWIRIVTERLRRGPLPRAGVD